MSRRHYVSIAAVIAALPIAAKAKLAIATALADEFATDNDRFDRTKFMTACGL